MSRKWNFNRMSKIYVSLRQSFCAAVTEMNYTMWAASPNVSRIRACETTDAATDMHPGCCSSRAGPSGIGRVMTENVPATEMFRVYCTHMTCQHNCNN
jgi:hypothetical protein